MGRAAIARLLESRGAEPYAFVLDEGGGIVRDMIPGIAGAVAVIGIAEKGYVDLELTVEGTGGHSSQPPVHTAIGVLSRAIAALEANPSPGRLAGTSAAMFDYLAPEMTFGPRLMFANFWLTRPLVTRLLLEDPKVAAALRTTTAATMISGGVKANVLPTSAHGIVNARILPGETTELGTGTGPNSHRR